VRREKEAGSTRGQRGRRSNVAVAVAVAAMLVMSGDVAVSVGGLVGSYRQDKAREIKGGGYETSPQASSLNCERQRGTVGGSWHRGRMHVR
jgi:hypothetical protein